MQCGGEGGGGSGGVWGGGNGVVNGMEGMGSVGHGDAVCTYVCAVQEVGRPCFMCACINVLFLSRCLLYALMLSVGLCACMY